MKRFGILVGSFLALGVVSAWSASPSVAATITVNSMEVGAVNNQQCGIEEAVDALNNQMPANPANGNDCPAGNGVNDTIILQAGTFTTDEAGGMQVYRSVTMQGAGINKTTIKSFGQFVLWAVSGQDGFPSAVTVTVKDLTMRREPTEPQEVRGVMLSGDEAVLNMERVRVTDVDRNGIAGGGYMNLVETIVDGVRGTGIESGGVLRMDRCAVVNNQDSGLFFDGIGNSRIFNSTFSGNGTSAFIGGGGMHVKVASTGILEVFNSTIAFNHAPAWGGGVWDETDQSTPLRLYDTIVANNVVDFPQQGVPPSHDILGPVSTINCLIGNSTGLSGPQQDNILNVNPQLGPLLDITAPIVTKFHPLLKTSPAIDKLSFVTSEVATIDARGYLRPIDGPDSNTTAEYDIGAVEFDPSLQSEVQAVNAQTAGRVHAVVVDGAYSNGKGTRFEATSTNDFVTYAIPVAKTGSHSIKVQVRKGPNRGIYQVAMSGSPSGPWTNVGGTQDLYSSGISFNQLTLGSVSIGSTGTKYVRFTVTGKNGSSTARWLYLDWINIGE